MKNVTMTLSLIIDDEFEAELKTIVDHKMDYLLDLDSFPEILGLHGARIESIDEATNEDIRL